MYQFEIVGKPVPQRQSTSCTRNGKTWRYNPNQADREQMQWQIKPYAPEKPLTCPVELTLFFFLPIPKGTGKRLREQMVNRVILPSKRPDIDNLAYLVTNALKGIVYDDDSQVCAQHVYKVYGEVPKTVIRVQTLLEAQPLGIRTVDDIV